MISECWDNYNTGFSDGLIVTNSGVSYFEFSKITTLEQLND